MPFVKRPGRYGLYDPSYEKENCGVGFLANIKGKRSHSIIEDAGHILCRMDHRGARGAEVNTGDGAGILTALPHEFLVKVAKKDASINLPASGSYAAGIVFLPKKDADRAACKKAVEKIVASHGQTTLGWRRVPTNNAGLGPSAIASEPVMEMLFVGASSDATKSPEAFDRKLFVIRKEATHKIRGKDGDPDCFFYVSSLSCRVMVYKGMLSADQLMAYYPDLKDPDYTSHLAMVHSRFSTNTFPSWDRAQPLRFMAHNGEINTLRGNKNKMSSRQGKLASSLFGDELKSAYPINEPDLSDSGSFDNVLELLIAGGRTLPEAIMMMIPEAWENHKAMSDTKKAFYEFSSSMMEPWDGPASISFTDGTYIGAVLDRNGLRPSRIYLTDDDMVLMASEVGVLQIDPAKIVKKTRLQPGKMFLVDFKEGRIIGDEEIKEKIASAHPYRAWLDAEVMSLSDIPRGKTKAANLDVDSLRARLRANGYTLETMNMLLKPMVESSQEALGSMGNDTPLAVLSNKSRMLFDYFKQLFAQVTNPPIDSIREDIIMSLESFIGPEQNLLEPAEGHCHRLRLKEPILTNDELASLRDLDYRGWKSRVIDATYEVAKGEKALVEALSRIEQEARKAIEDGYQIAVLSDRAQGPARAPIPSLLAVGAVHQYLIREECRTQIGLVLESAEPREIHHFCMLVGFGADAINPYLAFEALWELQADGVYSKPFTREEIVHHYVKAVAKGMRKVFGKMGISTLESYKAAQIFEAVGLSDEVVDRCFTGTASRIGGAGFAEIAAEIAMRHGESYPARPANVYDEIKSSGDYHVRFGGEKHMWDPESIADLQIACRQNDPKAWARFSARQTARSAEQATIRGLLKFRTGTTATGAAISPIPLSEVEPASSIVKRFATGAMSYGSISLEAHQTLAIAMNRLGGKSNTGEGGEDPARFKPLANGDSLRSAIKQVASGRFGVTIEYLTNADEIQIKMAQGAKPGEGGELPGHKVDETIAKTRYSTPGVGLISPPPHHDIYSIEDLAQLIFDLKNANPSARISVKLVSEVGVGTIAAGVAKGHADHILVSGHDGGTGASPLTGVKNAGLPWELGIAETHQTLVMNDLRSRVVLQTDGQLKTGRDVAIAAILGAEECGFATAPLITMGCVMMRKCHNNTCPVGIATQDPRLRGRFAGKPEYVVNFFTFVAEELRSIMASLGVRTWNELIGRVDLLEQDSSVATWKSHGVDLSALLVPAKKANDGVAVYNTIAQNHGLESVLDRKLIEKCASAIETGKTVTLDEKIINTDRATGTMLSHAIALKKANEGLSEGTIKVRFTGTAGQSFGAWLANGVEFSLSGDANDFVGKGLCGGRLVITPPAASKFKASENVIIGNVAFYGATKGEGYIRGIAAERFCVRNSGARVVVEGVGDHGCEYMTGGRAVILGETGRNFAAGMSGGIAYVYDPEGKLPSNCNKGMVSLETPSTEDYEELKDMISKHRAYTDSDVAAKILGDWYQVRDAFVKVIPEDYKKVLAAKKAASGVSKEAVNG
ncbi:MAG TPA: glutamate synthase large subunit [Treponemataceae bacterium]|nr:glutamate synthase large subunit [Treponemataceae bacterium]